MSGQTFIRRAALIGVVAPGFEYGRFLWWGIEHRAWQGEFGGLFVFSALAGIIALVLGFAAVWFCGYPLLLYVAHLVRGVFAPRVSVEIWMAVVDRALRFAPIAAALGVVTWLVYSLGKFPGWPGDVVFGVIGNLLGALVYGPLLVGWYRAARGARTMSVSNR
jgi:hypothetical protein